MNKSELRSKIQQRRSKLPKHQQAQFNHQIINQIKRSDLWQAADSVAIYLAFNCEADISALLNTEKKLYLPSIKGPHMQFQLFNNNTVFETLSYGLRQPQFIEQLTPVEIDLYLMPLVAFDGAGNRLGMGGGYYDRYFTPNRPGIRAGVAYACQQVDQLPTDPWDVKLQHTFTELEHITI